MDNKKMTPQDFRELDRLLRKARYDESLKLNEHTKATLLSTSIWASRRAG